MRHLYFTIFIFLFSISAFAQKPTPTPADEKDDDVIRISSQLVLVDALVLDKDGKQVTNLSAEDFEILQDGKPQKIESFGYVNSAGRVAENPSQTKNKNDKKALPLPPIKARSNQGRVITFVLDDGNCLATMEGLGRAREAMKKFINEQMLPDDKVAIYRTRGGSSLLQMYTSNKDVLQRIVDKVNWMPSSCGSAFDDAKLNTINRSNPNAANGAKNPNERDKEFQKDIATEERKNKVIGTISVLNFVIERLRNLPQRKMIFFISEGISVEFGSNSFDALREVGDKAARASVVIYTMSEKGASVSGMIEARDEVDPMETAQLSDDRRDEERGLNDGLAYLADTTGGKFIKNKNYLDGDIKEILDSETGYYLLGYQPDDETFKGKEFHKIEIKLKRADLKITSRKGFYGRADAEARTKYKSENSPMYQAVSSPFQENGIDIRLTTQIETSGEGGVIRALFHIKGEDLTLTDEAGGLKKAILDVVVILLDEKGKLVEEYNRTYPIRIPQQGVPVVLQNGLDYSTDVPVKKAGFYSLRIAVRDANSKRLGSAGDFIEIPSFKKDKFFMSNLLTTDITKDGKPLLPKSRPSDAGFAPVFVNTIPSIRQYRAGTALAYIYDIYNAKTDAATKQPKLVKQVRLYKNGKIVADVGEKPLEIDPQADAARIADHGFLRLGQAMEAGEYILQVIIRDTLSNQTTSQWIDFEVIK